MARVLRNRLKQVRHELHIDYQKEMADKLGIHISHYNRYEKQQVQPSLTVALEIAEKLNYQVEDLFYLVDE